MRFIQDYKMKRKIKINKIYEDRNTKKDMKNYFLENNFLMLENFFDEKIIDLKNLKFEEFYEPTFIKCNKLSKKNYNDFFMEIFKFLKSKDFYDIFEEITNDKIKKINFEIKKFEKKNYKILNDDFLSKNKYDVFFDFSKNFDYKNGGVNYYFDENKNEIFNLKLNFNSFVILKKEKLRDFIEYINNDEKNFILRIFISIN